MTTDCKKGFQLWIVGEQNNFEPVSWKLTESHGLVENTSDKTDPARLQHQQQKMLLCKVPYYNFAA